MKKLSIVLVIVIMLLLAGCTSQKTPSADTLDIVTSFYPIYIATANIVEGAEGITLTNLTSTEVGCLHDYQLTTANLMILEKSDILVINGGGMESFIQKVVDNCKNLKIIDSSEGILEEHEEEHEEHEGEHDHGENAHIWVSISLYEKQVENICQELMKLDEKNAASYRQNTDTYLAKLDVLKAEMHEALDNIESRNIVTFHEAFEFFAEEFDLNVVGVVEREPGTYPSAGELAEIIATINNTEAKAIFVEPQYSRTAADTIARETGVPIYTLDPVVSGALEKDAYEKIMRENLKNLVEALGD
ncbi:MAG: zinc ABC transporter substrate-binding protein [Clostridia bacterium]|nr:zinc ABC transporter substrate-binding protein [Clostridia bacterium]